MPQKRRFQADDLNTPGARLRLMREARGWTQETLAAKVYATQAAVSQWENNRWLPNKQSQVMLAELFETTRSFLFGEPGVAA